MFDDAGELAAVVSSLSERYESGFETPWEPQYRDAMLKAIIGVEIEIGDIQCKYKLIKYPFDTQVRKSLNFFHFNFEECAIKMGAPSEVAETLQMLADKVV